MILADVLDTLWVLVRAFALWFLLAALVGTGAAVAGVRALWRRFRARAVPATPARRTARACRATAAVLLAVAAVSAAYHPYYAGPGLVGAGFFLAVSASYGAEDARQRALHDRARQAAAIDEELLPPVPCCPFWKHSDGEIHGPQCERRPRSYAAH